MTRVRVDEGICQGYAQCNSLLPSVFEIDDDGTARVLAADIPPELTGSVAKVVDMCPTGAISLEDAAPGA
jgi:ferredoxin